MKLKEIQVQGERIQLSNLVIIVGPNGVGKTTFLRDVYEQFVNSSPSSSWTGPVTRWKDVINPDSVTSSKAEWEQWVADTHIVTGSTPANDQSYAIAGYFSHDEKADYLLGSQRKALSEYLSTASPVQLDYLLNQFGKPFKSQHALLLPVDTRLRLASNPNGQLNVNYAHDLKPAPFLAINREVLDRINRWLKQLFDKQFLVLPHNYPNYTIDVTKYGLPGPERKSSTTQGLIENKEIYKAWHESNEINSLDSEGHGIRAAAEILYALENHARDVVFIDEPELHLYPSTKFSLGRIVAAYSGRSKQIILVTHDTEILRGLLFAADATVLRIGADHKMTNVSSRTIGRTYSSDVLQAAFQDSVLLVEGVSDRFVYANAISQKHLDDDFALQVVSMYGKNRLSPPIHFYEKLKVKNAVIADFDIIFPPDQDDKEVVKILKAKNTPANVISSVNAEIDSIRAFMLGRDAKKKGIKAAGLNSTQLRDIKTLLSQLKNYGIFIVPVGELEDWVGLEHGSSPEKILSRYRSASNSTYAELTNFLTELASYLSR